MRERGRGPSVLARVAKLNPRGVASGSIPRGIYSKPGSRHSRLFAGYVTRTEYEARHGRGTAALVPKCCKVRLGRRILITVEGLEDNIHMLPAGHAMRAMGYRND